MITMPSENTLKPTQQHLIYASGWHRIAAGTIDSVICLIVNYAVSFVLHDWLWQNLAYAIINAAYFLLCETAPQQATPGKRIVGIYLAPRGGGRITWSIAGWRYLVWILPMVPFSYATFNPNLAQGFVRMISAVSPQESAALFSDPVFVKTLSTINQLMAFSIILYLFFVLPFFFTKEKTALHDWASKTRVYVGKPAAMTAGQDGPHAAA